jgi:lipid-binding SYLF domain-containing protein
MEVMMKRLAILFCGVSMVASSASAALTSDESKRLAESASVVSELRGGTAGIPEALWAKAECVVVIPSMKKAAFLVGGEAGSGVMSCRRANGWSAPVFMHLAKGSFGLQVGAERVDLVLLVMNRRGADKMLQDNVSLGADASIAAGPVGRAADAATDAQLRAEVLSYSRSQGVFAGIDLSGGVLKPDDTADAHLYGTTLTPHDIINARQNVPVPAAARPFVQSLGRDVQATSGRR